MTLPAALPEEPPETAPERPWIPSALALIAANAYPLFGVLVLHWTVFSVLLLYWCENVVVGVFNVFRLIAAQPDKPLAWLSKLVAVPFFIVHYGGFTYVHGALVMALFGHRPPGNAFFSLPLALQSIRAEGIGYGVLALFASHGVSFVQNFIRGEEYRWANTAQLMTQPYSRVMVLHVTILAGGFLVLALHSPLPALVVLIVMKTAIDLGAHVAERKKLSGSVGRRA
jgi:hypothetical protein